MVIKYAMILNNKYFIIRIGDFATNGNRKILYFLFSLFFCFEEYFTIQSLDCFKIMFGSSIIWTIIELFLHYTNTRVIKPMYIGFGNNQRKINNYLGICLQGVQEGGFVTTFGLYFADRIFQIKYFLLLHMFVIFIVLNIYFKKNEEKLSKRQINSNNSLLLILSSTFYNIKMIYQYPEHNLRQFKMFLIMIYISSIWTFLVWLRGFRKVEILLKNNNNYIQKNITYIDSFLILGYDVVFEIAIAYLTFYNLFLI